ncbi:MAG: hypothetical protein VB027_07065 [Gordonibacter sp.]|nr:hypothetical protein [Gordonibacter sp.]
MAAAHEQFTSEMLKKKPRAAIAISIVSLLVIAALIATIASLLLKNPYDNAASTLSAEASTSDNVQERLNSQVKDSIIWISVAVHISVDSSTGVCSAVSGDGKPVSVIDNIDKNHRDLQYAFILTDTNETIYTSGLISPGSSITNPALSVSLSPGTYNARAIAQGFDAESHSAVGGTVATEITLNVK